MKKTAMRIATIMTILAGLMLALAGCDSGSTLTGPEKIQDSAPPAAPTGLQAATGPSVVKLTWAPSTTDLDLFGYHVYRPLNGRLILLGSVPPGTTQFFDHHPWPVTSTYAVTAVDIAGNESAVETIIYVPSEEPAVRRRD